MDDWTELDKGTLVMTDAGADRTRVAAFLARTLDLTPAEALRLVGEPEVKCGQGARADMRRLQSELEALGAVAEFRETGPGGGPLLRDFRPHALREILAYFRDGAHEEELDASVLHPQGGKSGQHTLDDEFFLLPYWQDEDDSVVEEFITEQDLDEHGYLGQHLADVLSVAREKHDGLGGRYVLEDGREHTLQELADAFNYYLEYDAFLDLSPEAG